MGKIFIDDWLGFALLPFNAAASAITLALGANNLVLDSGAALSGGLLASSKNVATTHVISGTTGKLSTTADQLLVGVDAETTLNISAQLTGSSTLVKHGNGVLQLSGNNSTGGFTGKVVLNQGTLRIAADTALGVEPGAPVADAITFAGGTLNLTTDGTINANRGITVTDAGGAVALNSGVDITYNGQITGTTNGTLSISRVSGSGSSMILGGNNSGYTGGWSFTNTVIRATNANALGTGANGYIATNGATISSNVGGGFTIAHDLHVLGTTSFGETSASYPSAITLNGDINMSGSARSLFANREVTVNGMITNGGITKAGAALMTLNNTLNDYNGATRVDNGTLRLGDHGVIPDGSRVQIDNETTGSARVFDVNGKTETVGSLASVTPGAAVRGQVNLNGGALTVGADNSFDGVFDGAIIDGSVSGSLTKVGTGMQTLSGTNTYTGGTTILGGSLRVSGGAALADTGAVVLADVPGATLDVQSSETIGSLAGGGTLGGNVTIAAGQTLTTGTADTNTTFDGVISGDGGFKKTGTGTQTLTGVNTYSGATVVSVGTLVVNGSIASSSMTTVAGGAFLGGTGTVGAITIDSGATVSPGNSIGILNQGNTIWNGGSFHDFEFDGTTDSGGIAGTNWDQLNITGTLTFQGPGVITINLISMTDALNQGPLGTGLWDPLQDAVWENFITTTGGVSGYSQNRFAFDTTYMTGFDTVDFPTPSHLNAISRFSVVLNGNNLDLVYSAVPEPGTAGALLMGFCALVLRRRRRCLTVAETVAAGE